VEDKEKPYEVNLILAVIVRPVEGNMLCNCPSFCASSCLPALLTPRHRRSKAFLELPLLRLHDHSTHGGRIDVRCERPPHPLDDPHPHRGGNARDLPSLHDQAGDAFCRPCRSRPQSSSPTWPTCRSVAQASPGDACTHRSPMPLAGLGLSVFSGR